MISSILMERIIHRKSGWYLYSKDGKKKLGGPYKTKKEAFKRARQVQYFKHMNGSKETPLNGYQIVSEFLKIEQ